MNDPDERTKPPKAHMSGTGARLRRWGRRALIGFAVLLAAVVAAVLLVVHCLDRPFVKTRLQALVHDTAGVDIDYATASVALLRGIEIDDLVVRAPEPLRGLTPELVHVKKLSAAWTAGLYTGATKRIESVTVSGVAVAVVVDENGKTSFDDLGPPNAKPSTEPKVPLSKKLHDTLGGLSAIPAVDVDGISISLLKTEKGVLKERSSLAGMALHVAENSVHVRANLGNTESPLSLDLARGEQSANAKLWLTVDATADEIAAALDIAITKQSFVEHVAPSSLVHAEAKVHIDPKAGKLGISIANTNVAGGLATTTATLDLPDEGAPRFQHAEGDIDFVRALAEIPAELIPVTAKLGKGRLRYRIDDLALDKLPNLNPTAKVAIDGDFDAVDIKDTANVKTAKISAHVAPDGDGLKADAKITVAGAKASGVIADGVTIDLAATQNKAGALTGDVVVAFATLDASGVKAKNGKVTVKVADLVVDQKSPLASTGEVDIATNIAALDAHPAALDNLVVSAHTKLTGHAPFAADVDLVASDARVSDGKRFIVNRPVHVDVKLTDANLDQTGKAKIVVDSGDIHLRVDATKGVDSVDYDLTTRADTLGAARPFAPATIPLEKMALVMMSHGKVSAIRSATPSIAHHTELTVDRTELGLVSAKKVNVVLDSKGTALAHDAIVKIAIETLALPGLKPANEQIAIAASFDRSAGWAKAKIDTSGIADANVAANLTFDHAMQNIGYDIDGDLGKLASLAALAPGVDLSQLAVAFKSHGMVVGSTVDGVLGVTIDHVGWASGDAAFTTQKLAVDGKFHVDENTRTFDGDIESDEFHVANGPEPFEVSGFSDKLTAKITGPIDRPEIEATQKVAIRVLKQRVAPMYSIGDATVALSLRRTRDGVIHVGTLDIVNGAGGTTLSLKGAVDASEFAHRLSLRGELKQDLAKLSNAPQKLAAKGEANVTLRVESPDLSVFRTTADVKFQDASVQMPGAKVSLEGADGEVPILFSVRVTPRAVRIIREEEENPYSSLRFADQHPLLSRTSFISIRKLELPQVSISSLVGNFQITQNIFSLRQFEMGIRGGRVTGQLAVDWNGANTTLDIHVRADGVQSSRGEPFTGSAALIVSAGEHSVEGRADILQIGKRHLLDLLDVQDPFRVDPGLNRIRTAMTFGYPDKLRLMFDHGFASVHIAFGGLARIITIDDLKGVPIGPLIDQFIPPFLPSKDD